MVEVSIIMPSYNSSQYIDEAVRSVINQTYKNWELLICDDGSSDQTKTLASIWAKKFDNIFLLQNNLNKGAAGARNTCLLQANGRYIAFLDSDDIWLPNKLEEQINFMKETNEAFVFSYCENISEEGKSLSFTKAPQKVSLNKLMLCNFIPCLTVIYDTKFLGKVLQPEIKKRNDLALWYTILKKKNTTAICYPKVLAQYRVNGYGLSSNKIEAIKYFYLCLRRYASAKMLPAIIYTSMAIVFKVIKSNNYKFYNLIVKNL